LEVQDLGEVGWGGDGGYDDLGFGLDSKSIGAFEGWRLRTKSAAVVAARAAAMSVNFMVAMMLLFDD
jgi:hypothetical protein